MDELGKLFRGIFGFRPPRNGHPGNSRIDESDDTNTSEGRSYPFGDGRSRSFHSDNMDDFDKMFEHFHGDIFRNMESLHRQMEEMIRGFGAVDFPSEMNPPKKDESPMLPGENSPDNPHENNGIRIWFGTPSPFFGFGGRPGAPESRPQSPREYMLKEDEPETPETQIRPSLPGPSLPGSERPTGPFFSRPRFGWNRREQTKDSDIDGKLSDQQVVDMITKTPSPTEVVPSQPRQPSQPRVSSWGRSVRVSRVMGPDGKVEERRVVRDAQGREESTVTKSLGDQSHSVTTVTGDDGRTETTETFHNIKEDDVGKFDAQWRSPPSRTPQHPASALLPPPSLPPQIDSQDRDLFAKFFGRGWK